MLRGSIELKYFNVIGVHVIKIFYCYSGSMQLKYFNVIQIDIFKIF